MVDKKGRTNQKFFSATSNYNKETGYFEGKTPSKVDEIGTSIFNLGQSDKYWRRKDTYGIGRMAGWALTGASLAGLAISKLVRNRKKNKRKKK